MCIRVIHACSGWTHLGLLCALDRDAALDGEPFQLATFEFEADPLKNLQCGFVPLHEGFETLQK